MASTDRRIVVRSLPALIALLVALFVAPRATAAVAGPDARPLTHSALVQADPPAAATSEASSTLDDQSGTVVADTTRVLRSQRVTGPAGSRAPPAAR
ncbi:hypothetical protein HH310_06135 [Actinoplanes sp. TBRC 11911]|uniref:hypothetical protein n=1 Tax=Actinoplanes sp. TBRC 11911 TaxID=2729386 RepID=UPI00145DDBBE|nr:hypothetical protein [Actinoplanes sp. TBRC 11911]NMO50772.1 hypothetical protein [Actinoplanes sp. TBRC 11911]